MLSSPVLGLTVVIIGAESVLEPDCEDSTGEGRVPLSDRFGARRCVSDAGDFSNCPRCSESRVRFSYDARGPTKAGSGGMMNVVGCGTGAKSMMSLWLLYPPSLARCLCLLRLTKNMMNPIVQASRTQAPETDPAMIGVLALCLARANPENVSMFRRCGDWKKRPQGGRVEHTYPLRIALSEGLSARAACWIGVGITVVGEDEETLSLRKMLRPDTSGVDTGGSLQKIMHYALWITQLRPCTAHTQLPSLRKSTPHRRAYQASSLYTGGVGIGNLTTIRRVGY